MSTLFYIAAGLAIAYLVIDVALTLLVLRACRRNGYLRQRLTDALLDVVRS